MVEKSRESAQAPWRAVLRNWIVKVASGIIRVDGINWRSGHGRARLKIS
jgi:hypothetical protein